MTEQEIDELVSGIERDLAQATINTAKRLRRGLAEDTPKLTGRAAGSWNLSVGEPNTSKKPESYNSPDASVDAGEIDVEGFTLNDTLHISNYQDYINLLNEGSSKKAPANFIEARLMKAQKIFDQEVDKLEL